MDSPQVNLRGIAFRLLGSVRASDEAVRQTLAPLDARTRVPDLDRWLTLALGRICLAELRQSARPEWRVPDLLVSTAHRHTPRDQERLAGSVGVAVYVALDRLSPDERVALVLHDSCEVPYDDVAELLGSSAADAEAAAARARAQVLAAPEPDVDLARQRTVCRAFLRAARHGDADALVPLLHEDATLRSDAGDHPISALIADPEEIAHRVVMFGRSSARVEPILVNGASGYVMIGPRGVRALLAVTVVGGRIAEWDAISDPDRLATLDVDLDALAAL